MHPIVDSHCHLDFPEFAGDKFAEAMKLAEEKGVRYMQTICTRVSKFPQVAAVSEKGGERMFCSVGQHPCNVQLDPPVTAQDLIDIAARPDVIGIGETGLDYYHDLTHKELQISSFREHIAACAETGLPLIVHSRDAEEDTLRVIKEERASKDFPILIHCFTASAAFAEEIFALGGYISISGIVTFKNAKELQEVVKSAPLERVLAETDSPYLAPVPYRGKQNTPAYTAYAVEKIAALKNIPAEEAARQTTENFFRLFSKAAR